MGLCVEITLPQRTRRLHKGHYKIKKENFVVFVQSLVNFVVRFLNQGTRSFRKGYYK
jgi:hypothetical protein